MSEKEKIDNQNTTNSNEKILKSQNIKNDNNNIPEGNHENIEELQVVTEPQPVKKPVKRRFEELDLARSFPLLLLPLVHTYEEMELLDALEFSLIKDYKWTLYLCTLMPSVFMLLMGANACFSSRTTPDLLIKRGCHLLVAGVLLNVYRFVIPSLIGTIFTGETEDTFGEYGSLYYVCTPDIYDFAGVAFILLGLLRKYNCSKFIIVLISLVMITIDTIIPQFTTKISFLDGFIGRFIYIDEDSCFPLFTWFAFVAIGYYVGNYYKNFETEEIRKKFMIKTFFLSIIMVVGFYFVLDSYDEDPILIMTSPAHEYITDFTNVIMLTFFAGIWFSIMYFVYLKVKETSICKFLILISKDILFYYVTQWIIIGWLEYLCVYFVKETEYINHLIFWIIVIFTMAVSTLVTYIASKNQTVKKIIMKCFFL